MTEESLEFIQSGKSTLFIPMPTRCMITIYFPMCWKIGNIWEYFSTHPEMESLEPQLRVGTDYAINCENITPLCL